jgi:hypothetical protein
MNIIVALEVAEAIASQGNFLQTVADARLLYGIYQGGKVDLAAMDKAGTLKPTVDALTRLTGMVDKLLSDKEQAARVTALLASLQ